MSALRKLPNPKIPLLWVEWLDHYSGNGWKDGIVGAEVEDVRCTTVGFLLHEDERFLTLAQTVNESPDQTSISTSDRMHVLKSCITAQWEVTLK